MSAQTPVAQATAQIGSTGRITVTAGPHTLADGEEGPTPWDLMTSALAQCSAFTVRTYLGDHGGVGHTEVSVVLDAGPPTVLHRRVLLPRQPTEEDLRRVAEALERTEVTMLMRSSYQIRTVIEHAGGQ